MHVDYKRKLAQLMGQIETVLYGKREVVREVIIALLAKGHVLLEDVPGVGKTTLSRAIAGSIDATFSRIQLTPDMLPSDMLGVSIYESTTGQFSFKKGPIFANIVLADEINRTTPRTQSALLEAMNESQVTADGKTYRLGPPFMVIATQNPYEFEGTYFLPESQLDRFMIRLRIGHPNRSAERQILLNRPSQTVLGEIQPIMSVDELLYIQNMVDEVSVDDSILNYIIDIAEATRRAEELTVGLSPRGSLALLQAAKSAALLDDRQFVIPDDVKNLAPSVCAHRLLARSFAHDGAASAAEAVFIRILETVPTPQ
ncbi:MAG TPA: MoxR family ATPase [Phycisphaerae bacterium]|nr:MoxR family ATPase [Phycisphaerae bacterium]HPS52121.1 MoxR family ATPase [Phycisphaerae bacterium]